LAPNFTTEVETKPVPFTVSVNAMPPAVALVGETVLIVGAGLFTVKVTALDVPPPGDGFVTVTLNVPVVAMSEARIAAVICVALTNVVVRAIPLKLTVDPLMKFVPFTVRVKAVPPAVALLGEIVVTLGIGLLTVKVTALEVPPPGVGLVTVTLKVPAVAMSEARIAAVSCVALTKVVVRVFPLNLTVELLTKFVPFTVKVNAVPPAFALTGERVVTVGTGLFTVKLTALDVPPPGVGLVTVTL
jgi:hypothetical protein